MVVAIGHIFEHIFEPHQLIGHLQQRFEAHVDFALAGGGHFVVLGFDVDAQLLQHQNHFGAQILKFIHGRHGKVAFLVARFVTQVGAFVAPVFQAPSMESICKRRCCGPIRNGCRRR
jgi:hypothetical protein